MEGAEVPNDGTNAKVHPSVAQTYLCMASLPSSCTHLLKTPKKLMISCYKRNAGK